MFAKRLLLWFAVAMLPAMALGAETSAAKLATYRQWHDVCLQGDVAQIDVEIAKFEKQLEADPKDALARVFLGSACALRAKYGKWGPTKLKYLKRGKSFMEEAVRAAPNDARVRMVRAIGYYRIPKRFGVRDTAVSDFKQLIPLAKDLKNDLTKSERQALLYYASEAFREEKIAGASELRKACHQIDASSRYGQLTR